MKLFIYGSQLAVPDANNDVSHFGDILVVRHDDYRLAVISCHLKKKLEYDYTCFGIQRARRFIAQQDLRVLCQGPAYRDTLLLAARQFMRELMSVIVQAYFFKQFFRVHMIRRYLIYERDVFQYGKRRYQII